MWFLGHNNSWELGIFNQLQYFNAARSYEKMISGTTRNIFPLSKQAKSISRFWIQAKLSLSAYEMEDSHTSGLSVLHQCPGLWQIWTTQEGKCNSTSFSYPTSSQCLIYTLSIYYESSIAC